MKYPLDYCALRYLLLWDERESDLYTQMSRKPTVLALRQSLEHFSVSRSFKGLSEDSEAKFILDALDRVARNGRSDPRENVIDLAVQFKTHFRKFNVSAVSKLLWLKFRSPYIIYDGRALRGLKELGCKRINDYANYYQQWRLKYNEHKPEVARGANHLTELQPFFEAWSESKDSLTTIVKEDWFLERVFDNYLWRLGDAQQLV